MVEMKKVEWTNTDGSVGTAWKAEYRDPETGRRRTKQLAKKADLQAFLEEQRDLRKKIAAGELKPVTPPHPFEGKTVGDACDAWTDAARDIGLNGSLPVEDLTHEDYERHARLHIKPRLGDKLVLELLAPDCVAFRDDLLRGLSRELGASVLTSFRAALSHVVGLGWMPINPAAAVKIAGVSGRHKEPVKIPTRAEMMLVEAKLEELATQTPRREGRGWARYEPKPWRRWRIMVMATERTGLRSSELRGMPKTGYSHKAAAISVSQRADKRGRIGKVKSAKARRTIELDDETNQLLRKWLVECPAGELLFPTWDGTVENHSNILTRCWYVLMAACGLVDPVLGADGKPVLVDGKPDLKPRYNWHALRHFRASLLIAAGMKPKELQEEMGHSSIVVTMDTYGHLFPEDRDERREATRRAAALLKR